MSQRVRLGLRGAWLAACVTWMVGTGAPASGAPGSYGHHEIHQFPSKALGETYQYRVRLPQGYAEGNEAYPVLIVLDAEMLFEMAGVLAESLAPPMLLVGVESKHRDRDMTPAEPAEPDGVAGGADQFLGYLTGELLPLIEKQYRTRPYRALLGYSRSGLFVIHALTRQPETFQAYLAVDPSLHVVDQGAVKAAARMLQQRKSLRADLFVTNSGEVKNTSMMGGALKLWAALEEHPPAGMRWGFRQYPEEDHGGVILPSITEGLKAIFSDHRVRDPVELFDAAGVIGFERHYRQLSQRMGYEIPVPYFDLLWATATRLEGGGRIAEATPLFEKLVELEGGRGGDAFFGLAKAAAARGDTAGAKKLLARSLERYPGNREAQEMWAGLGGNVRSIVPDVPLSPNVARSLAGTYRAEHDSLSVAYDAGRLTATDERGYLGGCELRALSNSRLYCVNADYEFTFKSGKSGRAESVTAEFSSSADAWPASTEYSRTP